jgi:hypothetical protein
MATISFDEIRPLFGLRLDMPEVSAFLGRSPDHRIGRPSNGVQDVIFRSLGFDLSFRPLTGMQGSRTKHLRVLWSVFLYRKGHDKHEEFPEPPFGITFDDTRDRLLEKLGEPSRTSMPDGVLSPFFGRVYWDLWHVDGLAVHATYDAETWTPRLLTISPRQAVPIR